MLPPCRRGEVSCRAGQCVGDVAAICDTNDAPTTLCIYCDRGMYFFRVALFPPFAPNATVHAHLETVDSDDVSTCITVSIYIASVSRYLSRSAQPGHPFVGICSDCWQWFRPPLGKKRRVLRSTGTADFTGSYVSLSASNPHWIKVQR